ncbi:hypothetical protein D3C84_671480 [compost metagenome]
MADLMHYSPEDITILVAGFIPISGLIDGTFVTISKDLAVFSTARTSDGQVARLYSNDSTYTITITLQNTAESNDILTKLWQVDEISQMGKFPLMIKDQLGTSLFFSTTSWIESVPTMEYSTNISDRVWVIRSSQAVINFGANQERSSAIQDLANIVASSLPILEGLF